MFRSLKKSGIAPGVLFLEIISIFLGVALGFMATELRTNRSQQDNVEKSLHSLALEVVENRASLSERLAYYNQFIKAADNTAAAQSKPIDDVIPWEVPGWRGAAPPLIRSGAYTASVATGTFGQISFETGNHIANVYVFQGMLEDLIRSTLPSYVTDQAYTIRFILRSFSLYSELGGDVLEAYDQLLDARLNAHYTPVETPE